MIKVISYNKQGNKCQIIITKKGFTQTYHLVKLWNMWVDKFGIQYKL